jgi:hypothetical protein
VMRVLAASVCFPCRSRDSHSSAADCNSVSCRRSEPRRAGEVAARACRVCSTAARSARGSGEDADGLRFQAILDRLSEPKEGPSPRASLPAMCSATTEGIAGEAIGAPPRASVARLDGGQERLATHYVRCEPLVACRGRMRYQGFEFAENSRLLPVGSAGKMSITIAGSRTSAPSV